MILRGHACDEETACVIDNHTELNNLRKELSTLTYELEVVAKIARYTLAINFTTSKKASKKTKSGQGLFLVKMFNPAQEKKEIKVTVDFFRLKDSSTALEHLNEADLNEDIAISALVSASDVRALKQAYPNYFGSTKQFVEFLQKQIDLVQN